MLARKHYSNDEDMFIFFHHLQIPLKRISKLLNRSGSSVSQRMKLLQMIVPDEIIEINKQDSYYKKEYKPWNKGVKGLHYPGCEKGWFKKGDAKNIHAQETISLRFDKKTRRPYMWLRLAKNNWRMVHVVLWEHHRGNTPKGFVIVFKNKDSLDVRIENLELISLKENMLRNSISNYHPEIRKSMHVLRKLKKTIANYGS